MATIPLALGSALVIPVTCLDKDGKPVVFSTAVDRALFTIRASEAAENFLVQKWGHIEFRGDPLNAAVVAVEFMPEDTRDQASGTFWLDAWVRERGEWFDFDPERYAGDLFFPFRYGLLRVTPEGEAPTWLEVAAGYAVLTDDELNYIEVDPDTGVVSANTVGWTEGRRKIGRVVALDGEIVHTWPAPGWFDEGAHSGLDFHYDAGKTINWAGDPPALVDVSAGDVTLTDAALNYVQVDPATGVVSANTRGWLSGHKPLYLVTTEDGAIAEVDRQPAESGVHDDRTIYTRGDRFYLVAKRQVQFIQGAATPTDLEAAFDPSAGEEEEE